jgi:predicted enzyme involved in methoxymalonyl-ACP biosynthesis
MSCRVLGREIENTILRYICTRYETLHATFIPTQKNSLVENFYDENGFELISQNGTKEYILKEKKEPNGSIKIVSNNKI